jgi:hypothetical protein
VSFIVVHPDMSPKCAATLAGLAVLAFFSIAMNTTQHGWVNWYRMAKTGQVTTATVTEVHPESHRSCTFQYIVAGKIYRASDSGCDVATGQSIQIRYLPSDPAFATTRSPSGELIAGIRRWVHVNVRGHNRGVSRQQETR